MTPFLPPNKTTIPFYWPGTEPEGIKPLNLKPVEGKKPAPKKPQPKQEE